MGKKIAIDLGTANSLVIVEGKGIVVQEPTVVAYSLKDKKIISIGTRAKGMLGKSPRDIIVKKPLQNGVIASYKLTEAFIKSIIQKAVGRFTFSKLEVMVSVPAGLTSVEERAVIEAVSSAGASKIYLIPEPIAAAIGAKLPISTSSGNMIVNIGGGTAEIAVISLNGLVNFESKRMAGDEIDEAIISFMKKKHNLSLGILMAEQVKMNIGSAMLMENPDKMEIRGSDNRTGQPRIVELNSNELVETIDSILKEITVSIKNVLETTPPELSSDIIDSGIVLSGGTALIKNIDIYFTKMLSIPVHIVDNPLTAVVEGVEEAMNNIEILEMSLKR